MRTRATPGTIVLIVLALLLTSLLWIRAHGGREPHGFGARLGLAVFALPVLLLTGRL